MQQQARVELIPRMVPADENTMATRTDAVRRLGELGHINPAAGAVPQVMQDGWTVRVGGGEFFASRFAIDPAASAGQVVVTLEVPAGEVTIGAAAGLGEPVATQPAPPVGVWGQSSAPDPREKIPGWAPEQPGARVSSSGGWPA